MCCVQRWARWLCSMWQPCLVKVITSTVSRSNSYSPTQCSRVSLCTPIVQYVHDIMFLLRSKNEIHLFRVTCAQLPCFMFLFLLWSLLRFLSLFSFLVATFLVSFFSKFCYLCYVVYNLWRSLFCYK